MDDRRLLRDDLLRFDVQLSARAAPVAAPEPQYAVSVAAEAMHTDPHQDRGSAAAGAVEDASPDTRGAGPAEEPPVDAQSEADRKAEEAHAAEEAHKAEEAKQAEDAQHAADTHDAIAEPAHDAAAAVVSGDHTDTDSPPT